MSDIEKLIQKWREFIPRYAQAKANAEYLKEFRKSKKALLMNEAEIEGRKTQQERESYAYSHPDYIQLLEGLREAIEVSESLKWRMVAAEKQIEVWRTKSANTRKEPGHYGV